MGLITSHITSLVNSGLRGRQTGTPTDYVITCVYKMYADDVTLHYCNVSYNDCNFLPNNLDSFYSGVLWQMSLQLRKCEALCIINKHSSVDFTDHSTYPLKWNESIRYLGVVIKSCLT